VRTLLMKSQWEIKKGGIKNTQEGEEKGAEEEAEKGAETEKGAEKGAEVMWKQQEKK
jgi:hypothetical protein